MKWVGKALISMVLAACCIYVLHTYPGDKDVLGGVALVFALGIYFVLLAD